MTNELLQAWQAHRRLAEEHDLRILAKEVSRKAIENQSAVQINIAGKRAA